MKIVISYELPEDIDLEEMVLSAAADGDWSWLREIAADYDSTVEVV